MLTSVVERHRPGVASKASVELKPKDVVLQGILPSKISEFHPEVGETADMVEAVVKSDDIVALCRKLKGEADLEFDYLLCLCVVDYVEHLQIVYHLYSTTRKHKLVVKTNISPENAKTNSVISVWPSADWFERESHDLFGVLFEGHPDMSPLLLYDGFEGHPGLKSYDFHDYTEW